MLTTLGILSAAGSARVYATLDPLRHSLNVTISDGNLTGSNPSIAGGVGIGTIGKNTGKWYWETLVNSCTGGTYGKVGITNVLMAVGGTTPTSLGGGGAAVGTVGYEGASLARQAAFNLTGLGTGTVAGAGGIIANGDILSTALDCNANQVLFYRNGEFACTVNLAPGGSIWYPAFASTSSFTSVTFNFGQSAWNGVTGGIRALLFAGGYTIGLY